MIRLTRLNRGPFMLNPDLIEHMEVTPDTVITLVNGHQFMVRETAEEVVEQIVQYRRTVGAQCLVTRISNIHSQEAAE